MDGVDRHQHWEGVYTDRPYEDVGWFEVDPAVSMELVERALAGGAESIIDVGGGASRLVDRLLAVGVGQIAVLDLSETGLDVAKQRLGDHADAVRWIVGDVTSIADVGDFDIWHDRAVFHFLTDPADRARYVSLAERTVRPGGTAIVATFAPDGPERCSGLEVCRYDAKSLADQCGPGFELRDSRDHVHTTPRGVRQHFQYSAFRRAEPVFAEARA